MTAPCFNEKVSGSVWNIAHTQAKAMLEHNISSPDGSTNSLQDDVRTIALHILVGIGFGIQQDFLAGSTTIRPGHSMSYAESLRTILRNLITTFIFPQKILLLRFMPKKLRKVGVAVEEFLKYNHDMLDIERKEAAEDQEPPPTRTNLLSALVRASDHETPEHEAPKKASQSLSDQEILGNMFIFGLAGHDTTANTLGFAIGLLALYPEWQDWIREELDHVLGSDGEAEYEKAFPRLKRCQAVVVSASTQWKARSFD